MRVLLIKTSSLGDVIHTLPALTDALRVIPGLQVDWVVEESFADIAALHPAVARTIPIAIRRWRKQPFSFRRDPLWQSFSKTIKAQAYDAIIDAQGLLKSAWIGLLARGPRYGLDKHSLREPLSAWFYQHKIAVAKGQHAVERSRQLFAQALRYELPPTPGDYGLNLVKINPGSHTSNSLLFLHGTTWASKHYPENYWIKLAQLAQENGFQVNLPWGNAQEQQRAERIAKAGSATVLPKMDLAALTQTLAQCAGVIGVDSGLGHLACALNIPTLALYGPTNPQLTSTYGRTQRALAAKFVCAPCMLRDCVYTDISQERPACFDTLTPELVWSAWRDLKNAPVRLL